MFPILCLLNLINFTPSAPGIHFTVYSSSENRQISSKNYKFCVSQIFLVNIIIKSKLLGSEFLHNCLRKDILASKHSKMKKIILNVLNLEGVSCDKEQNVGFNKTKSGLQPESQ